MFIYVFLAYRNSHFKVYIYLQENEQKFNLGQKLMNSLRTLFTGRQNCGEVYYFHDWNWDAK